MRVWRRCCAFIRSLVFRSRFERELRDELQSYVDLSADERVASGVSRGDAEREARIALGGVATVAEAVRASRPGVAVEEAWRDACRSVRALRRAPGFAALVILTIALGVGANTAMFSVVDAAILKPLPYAQPDQLVEIATVANLSANQRALQMGMSWASLDRWRAETELVSAIVTHQGPRRVSIEGVPASGPTQVSRISPSLPAELGIAPIIGRTFDDYEARTDAVALLAEPFWRTAFHASGSVLGTTITIDQRPYRIIGVMPATLSWGLGGARVAAWLPFDETRGRADREKVPFVNAIVRLRGGVSIDQASRDLPRVVDRLQPGVAKDRRWDVQFVPLDTRGMSAGTTRHGLALLFAAVGLVLLNACVNVANLLLARALTREREIGIAAALGATRARLVRQFIIEGAVLAVAGGLVALLLLWWTAGLLPALIPEPLALFAANPLVFDGRSAVYGALMVFVAAVVASTLPALRASRANLLQIIGSGARVAGTTTSGRRWRMALQTVQVGVAFVLLTGAAVLTTSVVRMVATPAGYDIDRLATVNVALPEPRYTSALASSVFFDEFLSRVRALPGVTAAYGPPPSGSFTARFAAFGQENGPAADAQTYAVDPEYFRVAGIRLTEGRALQATDTATSPRVAVIDERAAELMWPGQSAIGQRFRYSPYTPLVTVVGVVHSVKTKSFAQAGGSMQAYLPAAQGEPSRYRQLLVRSSDDPTVTLEPIRRLALSMEPSIEFLEMTQVADLYRDVYLAPRFLSLLMTVLALLALAPAAVGLYAMVTHGVNERTHEIGVRIALGADIRRVRRLVLCEALMPVAGGILMGAAAVMSLARFLSSLLYQTAPLDPLALTAVGGLLLVVAAMAAFLPARRATEVDPVQTLRAG